MSRTIDSQLVASDAKTQTFTTKELSAQQLDEISAAGATIAHYNDAPKETITFEYGGLIIRYSQHAA
jgi:hypothetical protein